MFCPHSLDLYELDGLSTDERRMVRDSTRKWIRDRIMPSIEDWAWNEGFPREIIRKLGQMDSLGAPYSRYDLPGLDSIADDLTRPDFGSNPEGWGPCRFQ